KFVVKYFHTGYPLNPASPPKQKDTAAETDIDDFLAKINSDKDHLRKVLDEQFYRLCCWTETNSTINYRRFFIVNELICLNAQKENVFDKYHRCIKSLIDQGLFHA